MKFLAHPKSPKSTNYVPFQLLILLMSLLSSVSFGQTDPQWYVLDGKGRSNSSLPYQYTYQINSVFTIQGITHPNRACDILAKNELFIIYSDGSHFNSRESANNVSVYPIDFFYPKLPNSTVLGSTNHHFQTIGNKSVRYLYKTSKYEGDEPPNTIQVNNAAGTPGRDTIYKPGTTTPTDVLTANHDIVKNKNITLIINYKLLAAGSTNYRYYLFFDKLTPRLPGSFIQGQNFFKLDSVFTFGGFKVPALPASSINPMGAGGKLELYNPGSSNEYIYVNLHPTSDLKNYYPNTIDGSTRYNALFEIYRQEREDTVDNFERIAFLSEQIRLSHDPNKLVVQSICKKLKQTYICYHLEFTNTSFTPAQHVEVEMDFPDDFQDKCIAISSWKVGGQEVSGGKISLCEGKIKAIFPHLTLVNCQSDQNSDLCTGSLDFCIKVNTEEDVRNLEYNVEPNVIIYFDSIPYPLDRFIDPFIHEEPEKENIARRPPPVTDCETHCNFICFPCRTCVKDPLPMVIISFSVIALSLIVYRRLRLQTAKRTSN